MAQTCFPAQKVPKSAVAVPAVPKEAKTEQFRRQSVTECDSAEVQADASEQRAEAADIVAGPEIVDAPSEIVADPAEIVADLQYADIVARSAAASNVSACRHGLFYHPGCNA